MTISFITSFDWLTVRAGEYWKNRSRFTPSSLLSTVELQAICEVQVFCSNGLIGIIGYPKGLFLSHRTFAFLPLFVESRSIRLSLEETPISVQKKAGSLVNKLRRFFELRSSGI